MKCITTFLRPMVSNGNHNCCEMRAERAEARERHTSLVCTDPFLYSTVVRLLYKKHPPRWDTWHTKTYKPYIVSSIMTLSLNQTFGRERREWRRKTQNLLVEILEIFKQFLLKYFKLYIIMKLLGTR